MDLGSQSSFQTDEETHRGAPNADRTKGNGGANHVLSRSQGSYQCSLNDRKGRQANASVLYEPRPTRAEINYTPMEKLVLALLSASMRLKRYFQAHTIVPKDIIKGPILADVYQGTTEGRMPENLMQKPEELSEP
ncbi:hypothetical protein Tco_1388944 [Tanacetum coccineum]